MLFLIFSKASFGAGWIHSILTDWSYFSYIQDECMCNDLWLLLVNYGKLGREETFQSFVAPTMCLLFCSRYNVPTLFRNLQKKSLTFMERGIFQTIKGNPLIYHLWIYWTPLLVWALGTSPVTRTRRSTEHLCWFKPCEPSPVTRTMRSTEHLCWFEPCEPSPVTRTRGSTEHLCWFEPWESSPVTRTRCCIHHLC